MVVNHLFRHQSASINAIRMYTDIPYIFLIGGFGCGKSYTDVQLLLFLYHAYKDSKEPIQIGVFGVTIKLLKQTVIADLERAFDQGGIVYRDNSQSGTISVGPITFVYLAMGNPDDIYAFNFHCALCDEIDEVPSERVLAIVKAIQERCRVRMPAGHDFPERDPFIFFSTTAQGLGGTYLLIKQFEKNDVPYIKIRGRTIDNTSLAESQVKLLRSLYTEDEAKAFLDGEFVNLSTGRVYPCFDNAKHKYGSFPLTEEDVLYVGQDFNTGYNAAVIGVERGNKIFIVDTYHWDFVGDAYRVLREKYPKNKIIFIPDASGKEIMSGFMEGFDEANIDVHWNNVNPSVTERVTAINRLFQDNRLFVFGKCDKLLLGYETRDFDDMGKPRKGKGPDALDHWCDASEYMVWHLIHTIKGYDRILDAIRAVHHPEEILQRKGVA